VQCFWLSVGRSAGDQRRFLPNNIYNSALQRVTALGEGGKGGGGKFKFCPNGVADVGGGKNLESF